MLSWTTRPIYSIGTPGDGTTAEQLTHPLCFRTAAFGTVHHRPMHLERRYITYSAVYRSALLFRWCKFLYTHTPRRASHSHTSYSTQLLPHVLWYLHLSAQSTIRTPPDVDPTHHHHHDPSTTTRVEPHQLYPPHHHTAFFDGNTPYTLKPQISHLKTPNQPPLASPPPASPKHDGETPTAHTLYRVSAWCTAKPTPVQGRGCCYVSCTSACDWRLVH